MKIRVTSFDFDGCIYNSNYTYAEEQKKDVIKFNQKLLDSIKEENKQFDEKITFVGSNRQSYWIDLINGKGSCFIAVKKIAEYINSTLDTFLLADIYGDLEDGVSFTRAINTLNGSDKEANVDWIFDETKATILYTQMHKVANKYPNAEIIFDFYDDRGNGLRSNEDILEWLNKFYSKHHHLIPKNVTLCLHHYAGGDVTQLFEIHGTGFIDVNYRQTIKEMAEQCGNKEQIHSAFDVKPELLTKRKEKIAPTKPIEAVVDQHQDIIVDQHQDIIADQDKEQKEQKELQHKQKQSQRKKAINEVIVKIDNILIPLSNKIGKINQHQFEGAKVVANQLLMKLNEAKANYQANLSANTGVDPVKAHLTFKSECKNEIKKALPILDKDLGWGDYLLNILKQLANFVVFVLSFGTSPYSLFPLEKSQSRVAFEDTLQNIEHQTRAVVF